MSPPGRIAATMRTREISTPRPVMAGPLRFPFRTRKSSDGGTPGPAVVLARFRAGRRPARPAAGLCCRAEEKKTGRRRSAQVQVSLIGITSFRDLTPHLVT